jgi:arylformamidase
MKRLCTLAGLLAALLVTGCDSDSSSLQKSASPTTQPSAGNPAAATTTTLSSPNCAQPNLETTVAYRVIDDVSKNLTSLDIYAPSKACNTPVVMWVHGGGYIRGDKSNQINAKAKLFNAQGWTLVSVNYRLSKPPRAAAQTNRNAQFPDHYDDVAASVAWVSANITKYGGDPSRVAILGHSAGADIVSNVAVNPSYLKVYNLGLSAITCAAPLDTEGFNKQAAGEGDPDGEKTQWQSALGNNPKYLVETSATLNIKRDIDIPEMLTVVRGSQQRQQIEQGFADALTAANIKVTVIDAKKLTHSQVNNRIGAPNDTVMTRPIVTFLKGCFQN